MQSRDMFQVSVYNDPPYFKEPLENKRVTVGFNLTYKLPPCEDKENLTFSVKARLFPPVPFPRFIKFTESMRTFEFAPMNVKSDIGTYEI